MHLRGGRGGAATSDELCVHVQVMGLVPELRELSREQEALVLAQAEARYYLAGERVVTQGEHAAGAAPLFVLAAGEAETVQVAHTRFGQRNGQPPFWAADRSMAAPGPG